MALSIYGGAYYSVSKKVVTIKCRSRTKAESWLGVLNGLKLWGDLQPSLHLSLFRSMHHKSLEIFPDFAVAGARLETSLKCWSLQQNAEETWKLCSYE